MNLSKSRTFFDPDSVTEKINIIGCGSVGSCVAELLARFGITNFTLWDFDTVEEKNIVNQMFTRNDVGKLKVDAVEQMTLSINEEAKITKKSDGWKGEALTGYVFLCVDSIELRKEIVRINKLNMNIRALFDFRTGLTDAHHFAAVWNDRDQVKNLIKSMNFTHEEAAQETPVSACGTVLGVAPTVRAIVTAGVCNFVNFIQSKPLKNTIIIDAFTFDVESY